MKIDKTAEEGYKQKTIMALALIILIAACSPSEVSLRAANPAGFLAADVATCKRKASALIDRELGLDSSFERTGGSSLEVSFARFDAHKQRKRYFNNCLSERDSQKTKE